MGVTVLVSSQKDDRRENFGFKRSFSAKGLGRVLKWSTTPTGLCAFFFYFRLFIICNKSSTVKGITRATSEVDKSNLANFGCCNIMRSRIYANAKQGNCLNLSYGSSFFPVHLWPARFAFGP